MSKVQVAVRCRPKLPHEQHVPNSKIECNEVSNSISVSGSTSAGAQGGTTKTFSFDKVIPETASQEDVFEYVAPMVEHALDGLHATVFAYGQTGSGKTFTMEGFDYAPAQNNRLQPKEDTPASQHGVVPRLIQLVFDRARERMGGRATADEADEFNGEGDEGTEGGSSDIRYKLKCSFVQLYNERVSDLLNPSSNLKNKEGLKLRWTRNDQFVVENLYTFECSSPSQMREMFLQGVREKVMGSHHMNVQSSRSHCLFTIHVHSWDAHNPELVRKSELTLVDLAGSEKLALLSQNPSAQLLKESIEINTSLLALGKVITALASRGSKKQGANGAHIPYRDSKLTKLLKHALGGNSMTIMIACINPLDPYVEESVSTLLYAGRARNITNEPTVNDDPRGALIRTLREEISTLKTELEYYRQLVQNGVVDDKLAAQLSEKLAKANKETHEQRGAISGDGSEGASQSSNELVLAEKLIDSCNILKNLMGVNGQLRKAFDELKAAKEKLEQREVAVNAENSALRERIEMLESIALREDSDNDEGEGASQPVVVSKPSTKKSIPHQPADVSVPLASAMGPNQDRSVHVAPKPQPPTSERHPPSSGRSTPPPDVPQRSSSTKRRASNEPAGSSSSVPPQPQPHRSGSITRKPAAAPKPEKKKNSGGFYQQQLQAYANKYRNPTKAPSYEDYYGRASVRNPLAGPGGRYDSLGRQMDTTTTTSTNAQQLAITKKSQEVAALLSKLSRNLPESTMALIPGSLQGDSNFGALDFGGTAAERSELEEKRRAREEKLRMLREQNQALGAKSYFDGPQSDGGGERRPNQPQQQRQPPRANATAGGSLALFSGYSGAHDDFLSNQNYLSSYPPASSHHNQPTQSSAPTFGGLSPNPQRGRRAAPSAHTSDSLGPNSSNGQSATGKLFQYLSQEETESAFSAEQLEKLKRRSGGGSSLNPSTSGGIGSGATRASTTDVMPVGSRPVSATVTPRGHNSAPPSPSPQYASTPQHTKRHLATTRIGGGVPQPMSMAPSTKNSGANGSSSNVISDSPLSHASSTGSGTKGRRAPPSYMPSSYVRDPTKSTATANPSYIARLSEAVGLSSLAPSGNLTPRNKSSYEMGVYNNTPPNHNEVSRNASHPTHVAPQVKVAAHEVMQRRGEQLSEQQRYQQQMYEAQKALMDQQAKLMGRR